MKHELLVGAGDMVSLYHAVYNGADAIYIGGNNFGARKYAKNFSNEELVQALIICHLYGIKLYITMNTLIKNDEVPMFLGQIEFLHKAGVDAVIMQDFGMISLVREKYPNLEIHASTQANNSSLDICSLFYKMGVKRVVFSRELSLEQIKSVKVPIEKEVFVHGALCISYSGCCLMSSMLGGRSGNRGECAGSCRLPYSLEKMGKTIVDNKYLLSTKELNTVGKFNELLDSDIKSFKIEGRMKSAEYVAFITKLYRKAIDTHGANMNLEEENNKLKTIFNRKFTFGHLFEESIKDIINTDSPNHIGLPIGKVLSFDDKKIKIQLNRKLNQQDGIRFMESGKGFIVNYLYDENMQLINSSESVCYVDNKIGLDRVELVSKTLDYELVSELKKYPVRKIPITFKMTAKFNQAFLLEVNDGENRVIAKGSVVQASINAPITDMQIRKQIEKLGETPFYSTSTVIISDSNIFIPVKDINEVRRFVVSELMKIRINKKKEVVVNDVKVEKLDITKDIGITCLVYTEEQLLACHKLGVKRIYTENVELYNSYVMYSNVYFKVPRCRFHVGDNLKRNNLISDYFDFSQRSDLVLDYHLNVTNIYTAYYLYKMGIDTITLSAEFSKDDIINFINDYIKTFGVYPKLEVLGYGRVENMIIKDNLLDLNTNNYTYNLIDAKSRKFPVYFDGINTHILNFEKNDLDVSVLKNYAVIRLSFYDEDATTVTKIVKKYL